VLTDAKCRSAKAKERPYKLFDRNGLHLFITPRGYKSWRWKYRFERREKQLTFGPYPDLSLRDARERCDAAAKILRSGRDPARTKHAIDPDALKFETVAREWHEKQRGRWKPKHAADVMASLEREVFPSLGQSEIRSITPRQIRGILMAIQDRGAIETAHRLRGRIDAVFSFAVSADLCDQNPAATLARSLKPIRKGHNPAILKLEAAQALIAAIEAMEAQPAEKLASRLLALTAVRPGVIRFAEAEEFEMLGTDQAIWRIPPQKMKLGLEQGDDEQFEFVVPLARQAQRLIAVAAEFSQGCRYLFPSLRFHNRPISENALNTLYRRLPQARGRHVPHGWRSTFSTIMNERALQLEMPGDRAVIDLMLAHKAGGVEPIYNRAAYMPRRREIAQQWADMLARGLPDPEILLHLPRR